MRKSDAQRDAATRGDEHATGETGTQEQNTGWGSYRHDSGCRSTEAEARRTPHEARLLLGLSLSIHDSIHIHDSRVTFTAHERRGRLTRAHEIELSERETRLSESSYIREAGRGGEA